MSKTKKIIIGLTMGDPTGIGPEVIAKSLLKPSIRRLAHFIIIGHYDIYRQYCKKNFRNCTFVNIQDPPFQPIPLGRPNRWSAQASLSYLEKAIDLLKNKKIAALVTAPVSKDAICQLGIPFQGHTEFLAQRFNINRFGMMFVANGLRSIIVTRHIPLNKVSKAVNPQNVYETILLTDQTLKKVFHIKRPRIAVCGLNPHAGEGGRIGKEEVYRIMPAIQRARKSKIHVVGPLAADTLFSPMISHRFDAIVAMYHDQGLIPVKTLRFNQLVNLTIGLPFIRTSPAHGTAFDIAGQNKASPSSMIAAIKLAVKLS